MKIKIKMHPNSSKEKIVKIKKDEFRVWIKEKPIDGKANSALKKFLKKEWKKDVEVVFGFNSRNKIVWIEE